MVNIAPTTTGKTFNPVWIPVMPGVFHGIPVESKLSRLFQGDYIEYADCSLEDFGDNGKRAIKFLKQGHGLHIFGDTGTGKTRMAMSCLKEYGSGNIFTAAKLTDRLREYDQAKDSYRLNIFINDIKEMPLLIIDDLGTQESDGWKGGENDKYLYDIINTRWLHRADRITIITSNYKPNDLITKFRDDVMGQRIVDRIAGMCKRISLEGKSRRVG